MPDQKEAPVPLDHRPRELIRIASLVAPALDQILSVEADTLIEARDRLLQRRLDVDVDEHGAKIRLPRFDCLVGDLALDAVPGVELGILRVGRRREHARFDRTNCVPRGPEGRRRRQLVVVDDQIEVGVEVGLTRRGGPREQDRAGLAVLDVGIGQLQSTPGGFKIKKLIKKGIPVRLVVKNPDGKLSVGVMFTRT